ncbi:fimbria/pilus outer membrane usher protein [Salinicola halophilus]|uniref:fimbria/pilus outer membrane usher protein n=1 Tax=Salinicola halophilus TaxID=184065 RepID=UPI000DA20BB2|nr:fimbria/pilus outer membrane usher protein [Salinicola halophilus]
MTRSLTALAFAGMLGALTLTLTLPAMAQTLPPPPTALPGNERAPGGDTAATAEPLYLELIVNARTTGRIVPVRREGDRFWMARGDLGEVSLPGEAAKSGLAEEGLVEEGLVEEGLVEEGLVEERQDEAERDAGESLELTALPDTEVDYRPATQQLRLTLPSDWLPPQWLGPRRAMSAQPAMSTPGALINYDLYTSHTEREGTRTSLWHEVRAFGIGGSLSTTGRLSHDQESRVGREEDHYIRYDTTWRTYDQDSMLAWEAGDVVTRPLAWTRAVRLGGVQVSRNFALRPDLVTYPLPAFSGSASVPTTVDLLVNGGRADRREVAPGPYTFADIPTLNGAGEATLVTRDANGQEIVTTLPFYVTSDLLRPGFSSYSASVGALREDYAERDFAYGAGAADASWRRGLTDWLTLGLHGEAAEVMALGGVGATARLWQLGVVELSHQRSGGNGVDGSVGGEAWSAAYEYRQPRFSLGVRHEERSAGFADLSSWTALQIVGGEEQRSQLTVSRSLGAWGSVAAGYFDLRGARVESRFLNLSYQRPLSDRAQLSLTANREPGEAWSGLAQVSLSLPGIGGVASLGHYHDGRGDSRQRARYARAAPLAGGWGWDIGVGRSEEAELRPEGELTYRQRAMSATAGYYDYGDESLTYGQLSGAFAVMDGHAFAANEIRDAFVLVSTDGYPEVPVRYENQRIGVTDRNGYLLVPWSTAWYPNKYAINPMSLPINVRTPSVEQEVSVASGSGYLLRFPLVRTTTTQVQLVDASGAALPVGTVVTLPDGATTRVGWEGLAYFESLSEPTPVRATVAGGTCVATIPVDTEVAGLYQPGAVICHPEESTP